jgi:hypothetical protein
MKTIAEPKINTGKAIFVQACYTPIWFQDCEAPRFRDSRHVNVVRLLTLHRFHSHPPGNIPGTHCS